MTKPKIPKKTPEEKPERISPGIPYIPEKEPEHTPERPEREPDYIPTEPEEVPACIPHNTLQDYVLQYPLPEDYYRRKQASCLLSKYG